MLTPICTGLLGSKPAAGSSTNSALKCNLLVLQQIIEERLERSASFRSLVLFVPRFLGISLELTILTRATSFSAA